MTVLTKIFKQKQCAVCSEEFSTRNSTQKYCSLDCAKTARKSQVIDKTKVAEKRNKAKFKLEYGDKIGKLTLKCAACKLPYDRYHSQVKFRGSNYCSVSCKAVGQTKNRKKKVLVRELDTIYSRYIREKYAKDGQVACITCGKADEIKNMQNGHYVSRTYHATRWLDKNCHPQCYGCNVGRQGNYAMYTRYMINTYGVEVIDELINLSKVSPKFSKQDIKTKIDFYKKQLTI